MTFSDLASLMRRRGDWLMSGQVDLVAAGYRFPLPVELGSKRVIVRSAEEARAMLLLQRSAYLGRGITALHPRITAMDLPRGGRFRLWVDWEERAVPDDGPRRSSAVYYCAMAPQGPLIEMVTYTRLSMPELKPQIVALALSA